MKLYRALLVAAVAGSLAGCGAGMMWTKANYDPDQAVMDNAACQMEVDRTIGQAPDPMRPNIDGVSMGEWCMRSKGYRLVPADESAAVDTH